jgi:uncharacterized repeat protein (TIGR03803 family)
MPSRKVSIGLTVVLAMFGMAMLTTATRAAAQTEKVLHSFSFANNGKDGNLPLDGLILDAAGNLYGTTLQGGTVACAFSYGCGTVFELLPQAGGGWKEKILHTFIDNGRDGVYPQGGLIFDTSGNLYGTTVGGGVYGGGTVFELVPQAGGFWKEIPVHSFRNDGKDGQNPYAGLIFDASGNLYGTTYQGGAYGQGTVFELMPMSGGWAVKVLHNFNNNGKDGILPSGGLIFDAAGNLYGTTAYGGTGPCNYFSYSGCGTVIRVDAQVWGVGRDTSA